MVPPDRGQILGRAVWKVSISTSRLVINILGNPVPLLTLLRVASPCRCRPTSSHLQGPSEQPQLLPDNNHVPHRGLQL